MNVIIAAIAGGIVLIWTGVLGLLRIVDVLERKHIFLLGTYATLVADIKKCQDSILYVANEIGRLEEIEDGKEEGG